MHCYAPIVFFLSKTDDFYEIKYLATEADNVDMIDREKKFKVAERCLYLKVCFLAEDLKCFGYKTDCALYQKSNNKKCSEVSFNDAMDKLINKTMLKHQDIPE